MIVDRGRGVARRPLAVRARDACHPNALHRHERAPLARWNLFLAWIPFLLALLVYERARAGASWRALAPLGLLWLAFFPNAPYLITDLKHIGNGAQVPVLYDVLLLSAAAWLGLLLGLISLFLVHAAARRLVGVLDAWALVVAVLALSSFGIYLGRVQRWNSWDVWCIPRRSATRSAAACCIP